MGSIPGSGRFPGGGHGNPLQYSCMKYPGGLESLAVYSPWGLCPLMEGPWPLPLLITSLGFSSRGTWGRVVPSCRGLQGTERCSAPLWPPPTSNSQLWPGCSQSGLAALRAH